MFQLPRPIFCPILSEWISGIDVSCLDIAHSNKKSRKYLLEVLKHVKLRMTVSSQVLLCWAESRCVQFSKLEVRGIVLSSSECYMCEEVQFVDYLGEIPTNLFQNIHLQKVSVIKFASQTVPTGWIVECFSLLKHRQHPITQFRLWKIAVDNELLVWFTCNNVHALNVVLGECSVSCYYSEILEMHTKKHINFENCLLSRNNAVVFSLSNQCKEVSITGTASEDVLALIDCKEIAALRVSGQILQLQNLLRTLQILTKLSIPSLNISLHCWNSDVLPYLPLLRQITTETLIVIQEEADGSGCRKGTVRITNTDCDDQDVAVFLRYMSCRMRIMALSLQELRNITDALGTRIAEMSSQQNQECLLQHVTSVSIIMASPRIVRVGLNALSNQSSSAQDARFTTAGLTALLKLTPKLESLQVLSGSHHDVLEWTSAVSALNESLPALHKLAINAVEDNEAGVGFTYMVYNFSEGIINYADWVYYTLQPIQRFLYDAVKYTKLRYLALPGVLWKCDALRIDAHHLPKNALEEVLTVFSSLSQERICCVSLFSRFCSVIEEVCIVANHFKAELTSLTVTVLQQDNLLKASAAAVNSLPPLQDVSSALVKHCPHLSKLQWSSAGSNKAEHPPAMMQQFFTFASCLLTNLSLIQDVHLPGITYSRGERTFHVINCDYVARRVWKVWFLLPVAVKCLWLDLRCKDLKCDEMRSDVAQLLSSVRELKLLNVASTRSGIVETLLTHCSSLQHLEIVVPEGAEQTGVNKRFFSAVATHCRGCLELLTVHQRADDAMFRWKKEIIELLQTCCLLRKVTFHVGENAVAMEAMEEAVKFHCSRPRLQFKVLSS